MTNVEELFEELVELGQYPKEKTDTVTVMEKIGHFLDDEVQRVFEWFKSDGHSNIKINELIVQHLDIQRILTRASKKFDGGYVIGGLIGHGDAFIMRDPNGIRPGFYYQDDEVVVAASERPAIQTVFNVPLSSIQEIKPGHAVIIKSNGKVDELPFIGPAPLKACSFERIYFSRGSDRDIYIERKKLGEFLAKSVMETVDFDFKNTVFSFIPNTAEVAFYGLLEGLEKELNKKKLEQISALEDTEDYEAIEKILNQTIRAEKLIVKDDKSRTFIADESSRGMMVSHVYDVTYGIVHNDIDTLVLIDDSIVRGTTLRDSLISIAARLKPKKIIILSSAPQIRFPDCYGIDMSVMGKFVAFQALVELLKESNREHLLDEVYEKCKIQIQLPIEEVKNEVIALYEMFDYKQISKKITQIVTPKGIIPEVEVIFQNLDDLHKACPDHTGDWYFSGNYPTPGGNKIANISFINFMEKSNVRAYS
jgi:amidophosphoribosyltransferase